MPLENRADLPADLARCHARIRALSDDNRQLHHRIEYLIRRLFGPRSERLDPNQLALWAAESEPPPPPAAPTQTAQATPTHSGHGRKRLPKDLPRRRIVHDIAEPDKTCPCGHARVPIGEDVSEQLDFVPASYYVIEHVRPIYACPAPDCDGGVVQAPKPAQAIEKGLAGPGLLAQVVTSKYCDHLPLHRQERIFARHGLDLSRQTLCDWIRQTADVLRPVVEAMTERVLQSKVIHSDDTPVQVQDKQKKRATRKAYLWPYVGDAGHPYTVFDYTPTRSRAGPETFLAGFTGTTAQPRYLQCDAFPGYNGLFTNGHHLFEVGCWAHVRRKFFEAKTSDPVRGNGALLRIGELYEVEREAKTLEAEPRYALRRERARPVLQEFYPWAVATKQAVLPKSPIGRAIDYALSNWDALCRYTEDPDLAIDNNPAEQAVRAIALGRKNWLFFGSDRGGHAAAIHFSLIASARRHHLDPFTYLTDLLRSLPTHPNRRIHELFPDHWENRD
jgi:transposase